MSSLNVISSDLTVFELLSAESVEKDLPDISSEANKINMHSKKKDNLDIRMDLTGKPKYLSVLS
jgi:hypothetical protein